MSLVIALYLIDFLDSISSFLSNISIVSILLFCIAWFFHVITFENYPKDGKPDPETWQYERQKMAVCAKYFASKSKYLIYLFILVTTINCFLPSKNTAYLMVSAHYLTNGDIPIKLKKVIENKLDDMLDETKGKLLEKKK